MNSSSRDQSRSASGTRADGGALRACPFCGSSNVDPEGWLSQEPNGHILHAGPACDDCGGSAETVTMWNSRPGEAAMLEALQQAKTMIDTALPQFDWGKSFLNAEAICLLNETPGMVNRAIAKAAADGASSASTSEAGQGPGMPNNEVPK